MNEGQPHRLAGRIGRGAVTSVLAHAALIFPLVVAATVLGARDQARREDEVEVAFEEVDPSTLPEDLPPIDPRAEEAAEAAKDDPRKRPPKRPIAEDEPKPPEQVDVPPPKELPKVAEEKPPEPPPERAKPQPERRHEKMVDVPVEKEQPPPSNAQYLAEKNNRVEEETRATRTNLEREQQGTQGSAPSERRDEEIGEAEDKIAQLEEQKSKLGREAPNVTPHTDPRLSRSDADDPRRSALSMRSTARRQHAITPETADPSLPRDPDGLRQLPMEDLRSMKDVPGRSGRAQRPRLALSGKDFQYLFGKELDAQAQLAQKERSKKGGKFAARLGRIQSALENFIPEVKPGNQTALNTRAAPFAAYIARMHRQIHELWGFGFLEELEGKPASSPYSNQNLVTKLEIVLAGDGTIDNVKVIRTSGYGPFDVAAVDAIYSSGPYPDPPNAIRSANGKIYVHWTFHRDSRACGTPGAEYFILDNPPPDQDRGPAVPPSTRPEGGPGGSRAGAGPERAGPRRLERGLDEPAAGQKRRVLEEGVGGAEPEPDLEAARRAEEQRARPDDPGARRVAERWFAAYVRGDVERLLADAELPFRSSEGVAARSAAELRKTFEGTLGELPKGARVVGMKVYTAAGLRGVLGALPQGVGETQGLLFAVSHVGGDMMVLALSPRSGAWKAAALLRQ